MIFVKPLTVEELRVLKNLCHKEIGRVSRRAHMILMSSKSIDVPTIAELYEVSAATVRFWIRKFETDGAGGLFDEARSGRPPKANGNRNGNGNGNGNGKVKKKNNGRLEKYLRNL